VSGARGAALALAAGLGVVTLARLPAAWESGNALNHVSGVWLALADDLARGTFYRPLHAEPFTYGGTRYFPLVFALEALLARGGASLVAAGQAVSLGAGLLLAGGLARLLSALGARRPEALATAALAFAGAAAQHALTDARGDLLPVALSALALAAAVRRPPDPLPRLRQGRGRTAHLSATAVLLVLAFAAKPTALSAALAAVLALALGGRRRAAARLAALVASGAAAVVLATDAVSAGRFLIVLRATAAAGATARSAAAAPLRLLTEAAQGDPGGLALALAGSVALAAAAPALLRAARAGPPGADDPRLFPALWLAAAWGAALVVYASPGTGVNHLVELEAASAALLGASALRARPQVAAAARRASAGIAAAGLALSLGRWDADRTTSRAAARRAALAALPPGPILSEDPLLPLLAGGSPLVLDPFALRITSQAAPARVAPLAAALRGHAFAAVVLLAAAEGPAARAWYAGGDLGLDLVDEIRRNYAPAGTFGPYHLYLPRPGPFPTSGVESGMVRRDDAR
jgi:hypothetical protein